MEVAAFIANYGATDRARIEFRSNGQLGPALRDDNSSFRGEVCLLLLRNREPASDQLIRDLYDAESQYSKAAWAVRHKIVAFLASELLRRGGTANVGHYLECIWRGQDCYFSSLCVQLSLEERTAALAEMNRLVAAAEEPKKARWQGVVDNLARAPDGKAGA
jgi:hypothetical protein